VRDTIPLLVRDTIPLLVRDTIPLLVRDTIPLLVRERWGLSAGRSATLRKLWYRSLVSFILA
jgi:hypothetical protein